MYQCAHPCIHTSANAGSQVASHHGDMNVVDPSLVLLQETGEPLKNSIAMPLIVEKEAHGGSQCLDLSLLQLQAHLLGLMPGQSELWGA